MNSPTDFQIKTTDLPSKPLNLKSTDLALSPTGHLYLYNDEQNQEIISDITSDKIESYFRINDGIGLLRLGLTNFNSSLSPTIDFWQKFSQIFIAESCKKIHFDQLSNNSSLPILSALSSQILLPQEEINQLLSQAPFMRGMQYLNQEICRYLRP